MTTVSYNDEYGVFVPEDILWPEGIGWDNPVDEDLDEDPDDYPPERFHWPSDPANAVGSGEWLYDSAEARARYDR